jgi:hypothetical protein
MAVHDRDDEKMAPPDRSALLNPKIEKVTVRRAPPSE